jgi:hypothetical protein
MRVLLLHPSDDPENGRWLLQHWDRIVDLGTAGEETRTRWSRILKCRVEPLPKLELGEFGEVRRALSSGLNHVVDEHGLDWWELISIRFHEQIVLALRLRKFARQIAPDDEIFLSRCGIHSQVLEILCHRKVQCFGGANASLASIRRKVTAVRNCNIAQIAQVLGDKYDAGYRIRRLATRRQASAGAPVVLLPVANVNAAKIALSYAALVRDQKFLLVATRQSGWVAERPANVAGAKLAAYAGSETDDCESRSLLKRWKEVEAISVADNPEISLLKDLGMFAEVPKLIHDGLGVRNAWLRVFEEEAVNAVFCTDTTNPYTHMPLLLSRQQGISTIACHHGALDGAYLFKRNHADIVLTKGRMERDYLVHLCGVPKESVELGAPESARRINPENRSGKNSIIFFSEPYEPDGGRCPEIYRELLPRLAELASRINLELVIKLHPMESANERKRFVNASVPLPHRKNTRIIGGSLSEELLEKARIAVTIQSTAAVDCALRGIPVFLFAWLNYSHYGYLEQFIRSGAGVPLYSPGEIPAIPEILEIETPRETRELWEPISGEKLKHLFATGAEAAVAV